MVGTEQWVAMAAREEEEARQERERAMAAAKAAAYLVVEGQEKGDPQRDKMGRYELMEGKVVSGRGVWRAALPNLGMVDIMVSPHALVGLDSFSHTESQ